MWNQGAIEMSDFRLSRVLSRTLAQAAAALLVGLSAWTTAGAQQNPPPNNNNNQTPGRPMSLFGEEQIDPNQPLKPDFTINVSVVGEPDPSGNYTVDQAGNVSIRYAGIMTPVSVKGLTPAQAEDAIKLFLKTYVKNPQVKVSIINVPRPIVFIGGAVKNPGPMIIGPDTTLVDALSRAEWTENADLTQIRITRREKADDGTEKTVPLIVNFESYIKIGEGKAADEKQNPILKDKDRVFIGFKSLPGSGVASIAGEVTKPQVSIPLRTNPPMTVRELVNLVGGTTPTANRKAITIRRPTLDRPLVIDLDKAEQGDLVNNIEIRPDDAVYVEKLEQNAFINVNGGFVKTGKFVYDKRTTLTQAIMEAGGPAPFAKLNEGRIFRHPDNDPKNSLVIAFKWKDIQSGKATDIELQPGDTVWLTPGQPSQNRPIDIFSALGLLSSAASTLYFFRR
jgi:protein involved in polysaccharide export with SLBB domain